MPDPNRTNFLTNQIQSELDNPECQSSDLSVGFLFNKHLNLHRKPLKHPTKPKKFKHPGQTWPIGRNNKKHTARLPLCQQIGSAGGVHDRKTVSVPFFVDSIWRKECVVCYPVKKRADVQHV